MLDPGTALAVTSLVWDVAKDLYAYYTAWKSFDSDIAELRTQLLWLLESCKSIKLTLQRPELSNVDQAQLESGLRECEKAALRLKNYLRKEKPEIDIAQSIQQRLKAQGRKLIYPFKKSEIQDLGTDVLKCRDALHFVLQVLGIDLQANTLSELRAIDTTLNDRFENVEIILSQLEASQSSSLASLFQRLDVQDDSFQRGIDRAVSETRGARDTLKKQYDRIETAADRAERVKRERIVIESLKYPEMDQRRHHITNAHERTLEWIFLDGRQMDRGNRQRAATAHRLKSWLRQRPGKNEPRIFWIKGKPGSGKSSFVKFLRDHYQTRDLLHEWVEDRQLLMVEHFFWAAGSVLEKSIHGFLQHLLYQLLAAEPTLVGAVSGRRVSSIPVTKGPWSTKELWKSVADALKTFTGRVCLFIDGLDEAYPEREHLELVQGLQRLTNSVDNFRIVAASRPWPVFEKAFVNTLPVLTMEEINRRDLVDYIRARLTDVSEEFFPFDLDWASIYDGVWIEEAPESQRLVAQITHKAHGVFLWVALVVDNLCERLRACETREIAETAQILQKHVDYFPAELEQFFENIIRARLKSTWRNQTAMALEILLRIDSRCSLAHMWLVSNSDRSRPGSLLDPDFAITMPYQQMDQEQVKKIDREARTFLSHSCKDLVRITSNFDRTLDTFAELPLVAFHHRTIYDFLLTKDMRELLNAHVPNHFSDHFFELRLWIASLKIGPAELGSLCVTLLTIPEVNFPRLVPKELAIESECLVLRQYPMSNKQDQTSVNGLRYICHFFIFNGLYNVARRAFYGLSGLSCFCSPFRYGNTTDSPSLNHALGFPMRTRLNEVFKEDPNLLFLRLLLDHDANPNQNATGPRKCSFWHPDHTIWAALLEQLEHSECIRECDCRYQDSGIINVCHLTSKGRVPQKDDGSELEIAIFEQTDESYTSENFATAIKLLIQHGAYLHEKIKISSFRLNDAGEVQLAKPFGYDKTMTAIEIVEKRVSAAQTPEWQAMLRDYSTDKKRQELMNARREKVRSWPEQFLCDGDREFLGLPRIEIEKRLRLWGIKIKPIQSELDGDLCSEDSDHREIAAVDIDK